MNTPFVLKNKPNFVITNQVFYGLIGVSVLSLSFIVFSFLNNDFTLPSFTFFLSGIIGGGIVSYLIIKNRKSERELKEIIELSVFENEISFKIFFNKTYSDLTFSFNDIASARLDIMYLTFTLKNGEELTYFAYNLKFSDKKMVQELISKINSESR